MGALFDAAGVVVGVGVALGEQAGEGFGAHVYFDEPVVVPGAVLVGAGEVGSQVGADESGVATDSGEVSPAGGFGLNGNGDVPFVGFTQCQVAVRCGEGVVQEPFGWFVGAPGAAFVGEQDAGSCWCQLPDRGLRACSDSSNAAREGADESVSFQPVQDSSGGASGGFWAGVSGETERLEMSSGEVAVSPDLREHVVVTVRQGSCEAPPLTGTDPPGWFPGRG